MLLIFPIAKWIHVYDYPWMTGIPQNIETPPPPKKNWGGGAKKERLQTSRWLRKSTSTKWKNLKEKKFSTGDLTIYAYYY